MSKPLDEIVEVMARAIAERRCARDQHRAEQSGCDILLLIDPYLGDAREDVAAALAELEKKGYRVFRYMSPSVRVDLGAAYGLLHPQAPYTPEPRKED